MRSKLQSENRVVAVTLLVILLFAGCNQKNGTKKGDAVARAGDAILYWHQIPHLIQPGTSASDSAAIVQEYITRWARRELIYQKARENLSPEHKEEIDNQLEETRSNLTIYQYQRQIMLERMDTIVTDDELENYYLKNTGSFILPTNIVRALFIKLPAETPELYRIKNLARAVDQGNIQELESLCYQFAERFDDFNERWVPLNRISVDLPQEIINEENFLRRTTFFETTDSIDIYLLKIREYRLRSTPAPYEYVKEDIKRIIWNSRRIEFIRNLENGIYNSALEENKFILYN
jgi:hypothetical protein